MEFCEAQEFCVWPRKSELCARNGRMSSHVEDGLFSFSCWSWTFFIDHRSSRLRLLYAPSFCIMFDLRDNKWFICDDCTFASGLYRGTNDLSPVTTVLRMSLPFGPFSMPCETSTRSCFWSVVSSSVTNLFHRPSPHGNVSVKLHCTKQMRITSSSTNSRMVIGWFCKTKVRFWLMNCRVRLLRTYYKHQPLSSQVRPSIKRLYKPTSFVMFTESLPKTYWIIGMTSTLVGITKLSPNSDAIHML